MKKLLFSLLTSISLISFAQAPQEISYQGVARNVSGSLLANQNIGIKLDLHQGSSGGAVVFSETHSKTTNSFGLFTLGIGSVNTAAFTAINWANGPYFMEVSMDPAGGSSYTSVGTQQFMSVPYALYAKTSGNATPTPTITINAPNTITSSGGSYAINIPAGTTYSAGTGINLSGNIISNTAPDQTVTITPAGSASVTGSYPNFTISTPTSQAYIAGNGIDISGGVISNTAAAVTPTIIGSGATSVNGIYPNLTINTPTVAPDQVVTLLGTNAATVTGTYPNFTVDVPTGAPLPAGLNGQFLFNNNTIWDTLPRNNLFFNGTDFGIGTISPQATFHVVGAGRFDASVSTPQIYSNAMNLAVGTFTNAGDVLTNDGAGNATWQAIPSPTLTYNNGTNVLTLTQGSVVTTATLVGTGSNTISMVGSGLATVNPPTGNTFTVSVPNPTISIASGSLSISNGNSVAIPSPSLTINSNSLTINGPGGNTVLLPAGTTYTNGSGISITSGSVITNTAPNQTVTLNGTGATSVTGTYPNFTITSPTVAAAVTQTLTVTSNSVITSNLGGTATITPAVLSYTAGTNTLKLTDGLSVNTVTLNSSSTTTLVQGNNITLNQSGNTYTVSAAAYSLTANQNTLTLNNGSSVTTATVPSPVTYVGTANNITVTSNTINLATTGVTASNYGANATNAVPTFSVDNFGRLTTASQYTPNVAGDVIGSINTSTVSKLRGTIISTVTPSPSQVLQYNGTAWIPSTLPPAVITGTGIGIATVTTSVNNFTVSVPSPTYSPTNGVLSFGGTNTVVVSPTLSLTGTTLTSGAATNSVNLSSLSVWSNSVGVLYPTTLTNSIGIGTNGPISDKMRIDHVSGSGNTHLHLKQIAGGDAFSRIKFSNAAASGKYWINSVISDPTTDANSGYNVFYWNGGVGHNIFTVAGDGKVGVNPFGTLPNSILDVKGRFRLDSSLTMAGYISPPSLSPSNEGKIYFDKATGKFKVSENGTPYVNLIGGGSSPWLQGFNKVTLNNINDSIGIGTNIPAYKLDVTGNGHFTNGIASGGQIGIGNSGNYQTFQAAEFGGLGAGINLQATGAGGRGYTMFSANSTGLLQILDETAGATRLVINPVGRIGIGSTSPTEKLDVSGNIKLDSSLMVQGLNTMPSNSNFGNGRIYFDQPSGKFKVSENNGPYVDMIGGGGLSPWIQGPGMITQMNLGDNVGIGTAAPNALLDIRNAGTLGGLKIDMTNAGNTSNALQVTHFGTGNAGYFLVSGAGNTGTGIQVTTTGTGNALNANANTGTAINASAGGAVATMLVNNSSSGDGLQIFAGTGRGINATNTSNIVAAAQFYNDGTFASLLATKNATTTGGSVARLENNSSTNGSDAVVVNNSGPGAGISVFATSGRAISAANTSGTEAAGQFNNNSTFHSLYAAKASTTTAGSAARIENNSSSNGADAVFIYNRGSGVAIHAVSEFTNAASNTALWLENGHIKASGSSATVGTTSVVGGFSPLLSPSILPNSNDIKGAFSFNTGVTGFSITNYAEIEIRFSKNYTSNPVVILTPTTDLQGLNYLVSNVTLSSFFVRIYRSVNSTAPASVAGSPLFKFNYMVIE